jgi:hypothetical protein
MLHSHSTAARLRYSMQIHHMFLMIILLVPQILKLMLLDIMTVRIFERYLDPLVGFDGR